MTKKKAIPLPLRQPGDGARMTAAINWLLSQGLPVKRCTVHQIRVGPLNFWPERGTFNIEASPRAAAKGLRAFKSAVADWRAREEEEWS